MKIVIATPILYDDKSPFNHLMKDILLSFIDAGHEVIRIVASESETDVSFKMGLNNITYIRVIRSRTSKANIISRYIADSITSIRMAHLILSIDADVLFEDVSYSSFLVIKAAKSSGKKVVSMLQDVWPDNAVQSGLIGYRSLLHKYFELCQKPVYQKSDRLICISADMKAFVETKGIPAKKIEVIYNWAYSDEPVNIPWAENSFVKKYNLSHDKFYVVYAGNIGRMQNVQLIIKAAVSLQHRSDIHFLIIGDGVLREIIEMQAVGLDNVTMLPIQPSELSTSIYSMADINIIPLIPGGLKTALPSKLGICLACGKPILACVDKGTQLEKMLGDAHIGYVVNPFEPDELVEKICELVSKKIPQDYSLFFDKFSRSENASKYERCMHLEANVK